MVANEIYDDMLTITCPQLLCAIREERNLVDGPIKSNLKKAKRKHFTPRAIKQ